MPPYCEPWPLKHTATREARWGVWRRNTACLRKSGLVLVLPWVRANSASLASSSARSATTIDTAAGPRPSVRWARASSGRAPSSARIAGTEAPRASKMADVAAGGAGSVGRSGPAAGGAAKVVRALGASVMRSLDVSVARALGAAAVSVEAARGRGVAAGRFAVTAGVGRVVTATGRAASG
jgi:hypothetical protein